MTRTEIVKPQIPTALLKPCPAPWTKKGGPATTGDFVDRGDVNEAGLNVCSAQINGIRKWSVKK